MDRPVEPHVLSMIEEEFPYEIDGIPKKSMHKIFYLINKEAKQEGIPVTLPYFWFQFGTMSRVDKNPDGGFEMAVSGMEAETEELPGNVETELRTIVSRILNRYLDTSLEEITDQVYRDVPYDVQLTWRELDKKLRTHHPEHADFYEVDPSRESIQESIYRVYDTFPTNRFTEYESDLNRWYAMITRELNRPEFDAEKMFDINVLFWRIFALEFVQHHHHGMTLEEIKEVLDIDSFSSAQKSCRAKLKSIESETLQGKFGDDGQFDTVHTRAADAIAEAVVSDHIRT
jgi:hypothetical protein